MRKAIYFLSVLIASQLTMNAQKSKIGFTGGIGGGAAITNFSYENSTHNPSSNTGLTAGILWDVPIRKSFSFQPAINYIRKGDEESMPTGNLTLVLNCLETQYNFLYHTAGDNGHFFVGVGPSATLHINGKWKLEKAGAKQESSVKLGKTKIDDLKKQDFGVTGLIGYQFSKVVSISASYNQGLTNLYPVYADYVTIRSNYFAIKLGFMFKEK